jgi:hypothetical protein
MFLLQSTLCAGTEGQFLQIVQQYLICYRYASENTHVQGRCGMAPIVAPYWYQEPFAMRLSYSEDAKCVCMLKPLK